MTSAGRITATIAHREPDELPVDFGATIVTGMHVHAYRRYLEYLGIEKSEYKIMFHRDQAAIVHNAVAGLFHTDVRGIYPDSMRTGTWERQRWVDGEYEYVVDEWSTTWRKAIDGGLCFSFVDHPLLEEGITAADETRRRVGALAPGGGFVFAGIHNIQPDVPPENIEAPWNAIGEYR